LNCRDPIRIQRWRLKVRVRVGAKVRVRVGVRVRIWVRSKVKDRYESDIVLLKQLNQYKSIDRVS
jgi:hypothetical protein